MLSAIVATAHDGVIGKGNEMPWYLPDDFKHFREITTGQSVIMGRNTADSILARNGKALPNRKNIVITRDVSYSPEGFVAVHSLDDAIKEAGSDAMIIGGAQIYALALPRLDRVYLTEVDADITGGDAHFPELPAAEWREVTREPHYKDNKHAFDFSFVTYDRLTTAA